MVSASRTIVGGLSAFVSTFRGRIIRGRYSLFATQWHLDTGLHQ
jgi:hypothetical protein